MRLTDPIFKGTSAFDRSKKVNEKFAETEFYGGHDVAAIKTYRYLRLGMLAAVVALSYSLLEERYAHGVHCWLGSISSYYYTPVHSVFVGVMVAIGLALIVIKGSTAVEDVCLSLAGVMAPIVAFVPTSDNPSDSCRSQMQTVGHYLPPASDVRNAANSISNDIHAYLVAGSVIIGVVVAATVAQLIRSRRPGAKTTMDEYSWGTFGTLAGAALLVGAGWALVLAGYKWVLQAHGKAAAAMFVLLALAAIANGALGLWKKYTRVGYAVAYLCIGAAMLGFGGWFLYDQLSNRSAFHGHLVLVIEVIELSLFAAFWALQTVERWNHIVLVRGAQILPAGNAPPPADDGPPPAGDVPPPAREAPPSPGDVPPPPSDLIRT